MDEIRAFIKQAKREGATIGFVPTMGFLHQGHMSLIKRSMLENDYTVASIFVNPIQFGPHEDFERYPRDMERDSRMLEAEGCHVLFAPEMDALYSPGFNTYVEVQQLTVPLCGAVRPGHFRGVTTVVAKLFNIVQPDRAYFGQKDAQQAIVIQRMVRDLDMDIRVIICPIVREQDGLAMSSRNVYLTGEQRQQALVLSKSLAEAAQAISEGERNAESIRMMITDRIKEMPLALIDYVAVVDGDTLEDTDELTGQVLIALAVKFGHTRLIDNLMLEV